MSHQSDWGYYKQLIKLPLLKVNRGCEDFIPSLERPSVVFFFLQTEASVLVLALFGDCRRCVNYG